MRPGDLLLELCRRGVILRRYGDRLQYYPADGVRADELAALREQKAEVLRLLADADRRRLYRDLTSADDAEDCQAFRWLLEHGPRSLVDEIYRHDECCDALIRAGAAEDEVRAAVAAFVERLREMRVLYRESGAQ